MEKKIKVLYVEDDPTLAFVTKDNLEQQGYQISHFENGSLALNNFKAGDFDLCILDVMLPKMDGFELATKIRSINKNIPILFLSARVADDDRIKGLKLGADDYITKPFSIEELVLKMEVFLKRNIINIKEDKNTPICIADTVLDAANQLITIHKQTTKLTEREAKLLHLFFSKAEQLIKREDILLQVWGDDGYFAGRSLDVFISKLRKYIRPDKNIEIENIHGMGFRLNKKS